MLFDSSLRKELGRSFSATLVVLVTIVMTVMLIRVLGQASSGSVNPSEVILIMGYTVLGQLPIILTLSLFISVTLTLTRMYAASEMVVWFASGQPLTAFARPAFRFAWPVLLALTLLSLLAVPWSNQQIQQLRQRYRERGDLERVAPGQFMESANGQRVFFVDKNTGGSKTGSDIFIASTERGKETVTSARAGRLAQQATGRFLMLDNGQQLETEQATGRMRISQFAQYGLRLTPGQSATVANDAPRQKSTLALITDPTPGSRGELAWRVGLILAAINCVLFALATTKVNPRAGRSAGVIFALLAFTAYYNLLTVGQTWISQGRVSLGTLLILLHGGIFVLSLIWLALRQGWRPGGRRNGGAARASAYAPGNVA
ncbi:MAG: LPS export ABC transporter permease LptF [Burkholderiaceae bacterium]|jgi:lipopolysaccharide export system permease protein|nr:LPS export ABC transporter permease LptF [Burkholderiaceae bacterium]